MEHGPIASPHGSGLAFAFGCGSIPSADSRTSLKVLAEKGLRIRHRDQQRGQHLVSPIHPSGDTDQRPIIAHSHGHAELCLEEIERPTDQHGLGTLGTLKAGLKVVACPLEAWDDERCLGRRGHQGECVVHGVRPRAGGERCTEQRCERGE